MCEVACAKLRLKYYFLFRSLSFLSPSSAEGLFYRMSFVVDDVGASLTQADVERAVALWVRRVQLHAAGVALYNGFIMQVQPSVAPRKQQSE